MPSQLQWLTSRHDVTNILNSESRVFVLRVHPDHPVAQPTHGQDGPGWKWSTTSTGPAEKAEREVTHCRGLLIHKTSLSF